MIADSKKVQNDPPQEKIKFILELFNSSKIIDAKKEIEKQTIIYPNSSILFNILGAILAVQNNKKEAIENYKKAIKINPNYAQAYNNLGGVYHKSKKINEAIDSYKKAISLKNDFAEPFNNLGNAMRELMMPEKALSHFEKAIQIKSNYFEAYCNMGEAHQDLENNIEALENFQKATKINPNHAEIYNNIGMVLSELTRFDESILNYNKAINLNSGNEKFYNNLGCLLMHLGKHDEASIEYHRAIKIKPDYAYAYSNMLFNLNYKMDFDHDVYLLVAKNFRLNCKPPNIKLPVQYQYKKKPKKLKLGLISTDFGHHPGGFFTLSTLRELEKKNFELIAYSNLDRQDRYSDQFKPLFLKWHSIKKESDEEVVKQITKDGIHILMDLQGHSAHNRLPIFMCKPAPIQVSWLAQGSTGISEIDYFIGNFHITPKNEEKHFVEKIFRLPEISQCFTAPDYDLKVNSLPAIKNNFITFGCVNKLAKINDHVIALWSKILLSVPNSKLLLKNKNFGDINIVKNFFSRFEKQNINKNRLILKGVSNTRKELLKIYNEIDIALDPFPYQGCTNTVESVWMGVPVIVLRGNRYLFHFGENINSNLNMPDWIAKNHKEYLSKAIKFSSNIHKLSKIRMNLRQMILQSPICNAPRLAEHFSNALWDMWKKFEN